MMAEHPLLFSPEPMHTTPRAYANGGHNPHNHHQATMDSSSSHKRGCWDNDVFKTVMCRSVLEHKVCHFIFPDKDKCEFAHSREEMDQWAQWRKKRFGKRTLCKNLIQCKYALECRFSHTREELAWWNQSGPMKESLIHLQWTMCHSHRQGGALSQRQVLFPPSPPVVEFAPSLSIPATCSSAEEEEKAGEIPAFSYFVHEEWTLATRNNHQEAHDCNSRGFDCMSQLIDSPTFRAHPSLVLYAQQNANATAIGLLWLKKWEQQHEQHQQQLVFKLS